MKPESFSYDIPAATRTQTAIKRSVLFLYRHGLVSMRVAQWAFRVFRLRDA